MIPKGGKATAYVCRDFICNLPTTSIEAMLESIGPDRAKANNKDRSIAEG